MLTGGDRLARRPPVGLPFVLINHYGPTEATVVASAGAVEPNGVAAPSIGRPIANTQAFVLDQNVEPVPIGVSGGCTSAARAWAADTSAGPLSLPKRFPPAHSASGAALPHGRQGALAGERRA